MEMTTITLKNGLKVIGEIIGQSLEEPLSINVKVNTPYITKQYIDSTCTTLSEEESNGIKKVAYLSNIHSLTRKKEFTVCTVYKSTIATMVPF